MPGSLHGNSSLPAWEGQCDDFFGKKNDNNTSLSFGVFFFPHGDAQAFVFSQKSPPLRKAEGGFSVGWQHGDAGGVWETLVRALGFWGRGSVGGSGLRGAYTEPGMSPWWSLHSMRRHEGLFQEIL